MSAETDFRALLVAHAPLTALVGSRVAHNAMEQGAAVPYVVFTAAHEPVLGLTARPLADVCTITVQCWAASSVVAEQVADAVIAALATAPAAAGAMAVSRASGYDEDVGLDAVVMQVQWWS